MPVIKTFESGILCTASVDIIFSVITCELHEHDRAHDLFKLFDCCTINLLQQKILAPAYK